MMRLAGRRRASLGLVGSPNVGKSLLFNTLLRANAAESNNYPFASRPEGSGRNQRLYASHKQLKILGNSCVMVTPPCGV